MIQPYRPTNVLSGTRWRAGGTRIPGFLFVASLVLLSTCTVPTDVREIGDAAIRLELLAPPSLIVHEQAMLTVRAVDRQGIGVALPQPVIWKSSDGTVASVTPNGVVMGLGRGNAVITASAGSASTTTTLTVRARVRITPVDFSGWGGGVPLGVGDSLQFRADYVDVNGIAIDDSVEAMWSSTDPERVSVSSEGLVVGRQPLSIAKITASTADGTGALTLYVGDVVAELPATIRFAHTAYGVGPVTFRPSKGASVTLSFGEVIEQPITSGIVNIETAGLGGSAVDGNYTRWAGLVRGNDHLSLFAVAGTQYGHPTLTVAWANPTSLPADSALVRFIQGSNFPVVDLQPPGAGLSDLPELCYFDPGDPSEYFKVAAGELDIVVAGKLGFTGPSSEAARLHATLPAGRAVTYVLTGDYTKPETAALLAFLDPP